jgi:aryl-alcohol dehydrogenase-like predicted oxidoreductase
MEQRSIGSLDVSIAGIGCNNFGMFIDEDASRAVVHAALDAGVNHFDTADMYGDGRSEEFLGRALGPRRSEVVLVTKFGSYAPEGTPGASPAYVPQALDASLARLGTDHVDLLLLHRPDGVTPIGDTIEAMDALVRAGKAREIGCSNFDPALLREAAKAAEERGVRSFVNLQNQYSVLEPSVEDEVLPTCEALGVAFVPFFPLASGVLTGKYRRDQPRPSGTRLSTGPFSDRWLTDENFAIVDRLDEYATAHDHTLLELALGYVASAPAVASVIAGATKPEQVRANVAAMEAWAMTPGERAEVRALVVGGQD